MASDNWDNLNTWSDGNPANMNYGGFGGDGYAAWSDYGTMNMNEDIFDIGGIGPPTAAEELNEYVNHLSTYLQNIMASAPSEVRKTVCT